MGLYYKDRVDLDVTGPLCADDDVSEPSSQSCVFLVVWFWKAYWNPFSGAVCCISFCQGVHLSPSVSEPVRSVNNEIRVYITLFGGSYVKDM